MYTSFTDWKSGVYLEHHGVLGMKWGVRRYQNRDGTLTEAGKQRYVISKKDIKAIDKRIKKRGERDQRLTQEHTIPKGTIVYRTTSVENEDGEGSTYVSYAKTDRVHYKSGWIRAHGKTGKEYENQYELKEDVHIPSRKETYEVINNVMRKNKALVTKTVNDWADTTLPKNGWRWREYVEHEQNQMLPGSKKSEKQIRKEYVDAILKNYKSYTPEIAAFFTMQTFGVNTTVKNQVIKELKSRGYNAMTDEASVGGQNGWAREGADPLILFDRKSSLQKKSTYEIPEWVNESYQDEYMRRIAKARRKYFENTSGAWSDIK